MKLLSTIHSYGSLAKCKGMQAVLPKKLTKSEEIFFVIRYARIKEELGGKHCRCCQNSCCDCQKRLDTRRSFVTY